MALRFRLSRYIQVKKTVLKDAGRASSQRRYMSAVAAVSAEWTLETDIYSPELSCNIQAVLSATGRHGWPAAWRYTGRLIQRSQTPFTSVRTPGAALQTPEEDAFTRITTAPSGEVCVALQVNGHSCLCAHCRGVNPMHWWSKINDN